MAAINPQIERQQVAGCSALTKLVIHELLDDS
jgi:hypothetical protein